MNDKEESELVDKISRMGPRHKITIGGPPQRSFSLMPSSLGEAVEIAGMIAASDFAPKDYRGKPGNVMIAIQMGADVGLKPMQSLQGIAVINGRPSIWGDAALALVQASGVLERFHETISGEGDARTATCIIKRAGLPDEIKRTFSVADAKLAKLWGKTGKEGQPTPWVTYPDRMLQMRARGFAIRDAAADRMMGLVLAEEAMDYPDAIDVQATAVSEVVNPLAKASEEDQVRINKAFETLALSPALRLTKVNEFLGGEGADHIDARVGALLEWCRDEYARRKTGQPVQRSGDTNAKAKPAGPATPSTGDRRDGEGTGPAVAPAGAVAEPAKGAKVATPETQAPLTAGEVFGGAKPKQDWEF